MNAIRVASVGRGVLNLNYMQMWESESQITANCVKLIAVLILLGIAVAVGLTFCMICYELYYCLYCTTKKQQKKLYNSRHD